MAETAVTPVTPEAPPAAPTMEQELKDLFQSEEGKTATAPENEITPVKDEIQTPELNTQLEEIAKEGDVPAADAPKIPEAQQQILNAIPTLEAARQLAQNSQYFEQLNTAIGNRDFEAVETMFDTAALEDFKDHLYQKYGETFVDRWVAEKEGTAPIHKGMATLERQVQQLKAQLDARGTKETEAQQKAAQGKVSQDYVAHISGLFDKIQFSSADRRWVFADINNRVAGNPNVRAQINSGNVKAVNKIFSDAVREYSTRDQAQQTEKDTKLAAQDVKKPLGPAGAIAVQSDKITDEMVNAAPKSERSALLERKMNQELADLFRK